MTAETIGERLQRLRLEAGLSQRQLAVPEQGVSYAYISRIESGDRRPSLRAVRTLAERLGVNAVYLETGQLDECPHCRQAFPAVDGETVVVTDAFYREKLGLPPRQPLEPE